MILITEWTYTINITISMGNNDSSANETRWCTIVNPSRRRELRQQNPRFEADLVYIARYCLQKPT